MQPTLKNTTNSVTTNPNGPLVSPWANTAAVRPSINDISPDRIMREEYERLIRGCIADPQQWQAVHRIKPDAAPGILMLAMMRQGMDRAWALAAEMVMELTMSPAHLFAVCEDGIAYSENERTAVFGSQASADRFRARFGEWTAVVGEGNERPV